MRALKKRDGSLVFVLMLGAMVPWCRAESLGDPTRPPAGVVPLVVDMVGEEPRISPVWDLRLVRITPRVRSALLNGQRVHEGDVVDEAKILEIRSSGVLLEWAGERVQVQLGGGLSSGGNTGFMRKTRIHK